jgi:hypothetical protein
MDSPKTVMANYWMQYNVTFVQSGSGGSPHVTVDGVEYQLPYSLWLDKGSSHTFSYESPVSGDLGVQYILSYTSPYTSPFNVSYASTITGYYTTQFYITITSAHGTPTSPQWVNEGYSLTVSVQSPAETVAEQTQWLCTGFSIDQAPIQSGTSYEFYNIQVQLDTTVLATGYYERKRRNGAWHWMARQRNVSDMHCPNSKRIHI